MSATLTSLANVLKSNQINISEAERQNYGKDWTTYFDIKALAVVFPESTEDVIRLVKWARKEKVALIPSGGRTGLSGAAVATQNEVVVSIERMNKIKDFSDIDNTVVIEAGVITEELQNFAKLKNLLYPVDFAARGSSQMGGNIATNAGGIKVVRYGLTRDWVVGLKVVTGAGDILELNNGLIKNATGYDLRHLFIGSEGTLGFITEATIKLAPAPPPLRVLLLATHGLDSLMKIFAAFKASTQLTAFEMFSDKALSHVVKAKGLPVPFQNPSEYYTVLEVECPNDEAEQKILEVFEECLANELISDGLLAQSEGQAKTFWRYREDISESLSAYSPYKNDISVRIASVPNFLEDLNHVLAQHYPTWEVIWFGHIGDGNLHINILRPSSMTKEEFVKSCQQVDQLVFTAVKKHKGSISAEHGVGLTKKPFIEYTRSKSEVEIMRGIKKVFDPDNIINPGKIFD